MSCFWTEPQMPVWVAYRFVVNMESHLLHFTHLSPDRAHTQGQWHLIKPDPQGLYSNNWEADPTPDRSVTATHQRGPTQLPDKAIVTTTPATPPIKRVTASIPFGCMPVMTCKQCLHPEYWTHTVCTGMVAHKNSPSGPQ